MVVKKELVARQTVVAEVVPMIAGDEEISVVQQAKLIDCSVDLSVRVINGHQRAASLLGQLVDALDIMIIKWWLARNQVVKLWR